MKVNWKLFLAEHTQDFVGYLFACDDGAASQAAAALAAFRAHQVAPAPRATLYLEFGRRAKALSDPFVCFRLTACHELHIPLLCVAAYPAACLSSVSLDRLLALFFSSASLSLFLRFLASAMPGSGASNRLIRRPMNTG